MLIFIRQSISANVERSVHMLKKVYRLELQGPICAKYVYKTNDL